MLKLSFACAALGLVLLAISALPAVGAAPPAPAAMVAPAPTPEPPSGRALFVAKGCATCHHHAAVPGSGALGQGEAPDLSAARWDAAFLRRWLSDPSAVKPSTAMPTLGLQPAEIDALIAFLLAAK